jgi:two-component system, OmpR family, sensor kinase
MKKRSILFTVNLTFFIAFFLISVSFLPLYHMNKKREEFFIHKRGMNVSHMFMDDYRFFGMGEQLQNDIHRFDFSFIKDPAAIEKIMQNPALQREHTMRRHAFFFEYMRLHNHYYIHIMTPQGEVLLEDKLVQDNFGSTVLVYAAILAVFLFLYLSILKKLKPLKTLSRLVKNIGEERFDIDYTATGDDEISKLIREFKNSAQNLKKIKESRNIFIRNIMHELKTPIAKGKFLTHLPETSQNKEKMQKVFYRLEALINEFAAIEELIATKKTLVKKEYNLEDIVDNAEDILMCNENEVSKDFEPITLNVDFDIFSIAVKNLLDNGIKYSPNRKVTVKTEGKNIVFQNDGEALAHPLENYFEPFFRDGEVKSNQSFGLGLYIVKHILDAHSMQLHYRRSQNSNLFILSSLS